MIKTQISLNKDKISQENIIKINYLQIKFDKILNDKISVFNELKSHYTFTNVFDTEFGNKVKNSYVCKYLGEYEYEGLLKYLKKFVSGIPLYYKYNNIIKLEDIYEYRLKTKDKNGIIKIANRNNGSKEYTRVQIKNAIKFEAICLYNKFKDWSNSDILKYLYVIGLYFFRTVNNCMTDSDNPMDPKYNPITFDEIKRMSETVYDEVFNKHEKFVYDKNLRKITIQSEMAAFFDKAETLISLIDEYKKIANGDIKLSKFADWLQLKDINIKKEALLHYINNFNLREMVGMSAEKKPGTRKPGQIKTKKQKELEKQQQEQQMCNVININNLEADKQQIDKQLENDVFYKVKRCIL